MTCSLNKELVRNVLLLLFKIWNNRLHSREYDISEAIFMLSMDVVSRAFLEPDVVSKSIFVHTVSVGVFCTGKNRVVKFAW
jgi:hypothetical protein